MNPGPCTRIEAYSAAACLHDSDHVSPIARVHTQYPISDPDSTDHVSPLGRAPSLPPTLLQSTVSPSPV
eukprot:551739-Rhodomonas_salina.1